MVNLLSLNLRNEALQYNDSYIVSTKSKTNLISFLKTIETILKNNKNTLLKFEKRSYFVALAKRSIIQCLNERSLYEGNKVLKIWKSIQSLHPITIFSTVPLELQFLIFSYLKSNELNALSRANLYLNQKVKTFYLEKAISIGYDKDTYRKIQNFSSRVLNVFYDNHELYSQKIYEERHFFSQNFSLLYDYFQYDNNTKIRLYSSIIYLRKNITHSKILRLLSIESNYYYPYSLASLAGLLLNVKKGTDASLPYSEQEAILFCYWQALIRALLCKNKYTVNILLSYKRDYFQQLVDLEYLEENGYFTRFKDTWMLLKHVSERLDLFIINCTEKSSKNKKMIFLEDSDLYKKVIKEPFNIFFSTNFDENLLEDYFFLSLLRAGNNNPLHLLLEWFERCYQAVDRLIFLNKILSKT